jgi:hypothetical protein
VSPEDASAEDPNGDDTSRENEGPEDASEISRDVGLCGACTFARRVENRRGSVFYHCGRSAEDTRFPKYPILPVLTCPGFEAPSRPPRP